MAITVKGKPDKLTPVYNEVNFYADSTNKSKSGFRYLFKLEVTGVTTTPIFKAPPRPGDGYGVFKAAEALQCLLSYDINPESVAAFEAQNSRVEFSVKIGEEYLAEFNLVSWVQQTTGNYTGKVILTRLTGHTFLVGDQIQVSQNDGGTSVPALEGLFTVLEKTATTVTIDLNFYLISGLTPVAGKVYYSDLRKVQFLDLLTESGYVGFNAAFDKLEFNSISWNDYKQTTATNSKKFITGMPNNFRLSEDQHAFFNIATLGNSAAAYLEVTNDAGDRFKADIVADAPNLLMQIPVSPFNMALTLLAGSAPLVKPDTKFYTIRIKTSGAAGVSELRTFYINRKCNKKGIYLDFVDAFGAVGSFPFPLKAELKHDNTKERGQFEEGELVLENSKFEYYTKQGGEEVIRSEKVESWTLTTDWLTNSEMLYFNQLIDSPCVLMYEAGELVGRVDVVTASTVTPHPNKKKLTNRSIEVRFSKQNEVNI